MDSKLSNGLRKLIFARTRARTHTRSIALSICLISSAIFAVAQVLPDGKQDPQFIFGQDSRIHGIVLNHGQEQSTRQKMGILDDCQFAKQATYAMALVGSEGASLDLHIKSHRGLFVLEGLVSGAEPKILSTQFLAPYKNHPASLPGEIRMLPGSRYPLALTIAAKFAGDGDLAFQNGDSIVLHADGQLYVYPLPPITIPSEGILRVYLGTDDSLYFDAALRHPVHAGSCRSKKK